MTGDVKFRGYPGAILEFVREQGPLTPGRYSVASQAGRATGCTVERARLSLVKLANAEVVRLEFAGPRRIVRAEAVK